MGMDRGATTIFGRSLSHKSVKRGADSMRIMESVGVDVDLCIPMDSGMGGCAAPTASVRGTNFSFTRSSVSHTLSVGCASAALAADGPVGSDEMSTSPLDGPIVGPRHFLAASESIGYGAHVSSCFLQ